MTNTKSLSRRTYSILHISYETEVVFDFEKDGEAHKFKYNIRGENFEDIETKARQLHNYIYKKLLSEWKRMTHNSIKYAYNNEEIPLPK